VFVCMNTRDWNLASPARLDRRFKSCKRGLTTPLPSSMGTFALPPGFRFHPTDEELIFNYLKVKLKNGLKASEVEVIPDVDLYRCEPWDLPGNFDFFFSEGQIHGFSLNSYNSSMFLN